MSNNVKSAGNQQEIRRRRMRGRPSETTRQAPSVAACRAYLLGALHDGTFNQHNQRYRFAQKGTDWLKILKNCLTITGNSSWVYKEGVHREVYVLETRAKFLDVYFNPLQLVTTKEKKAYLRGFFDAEGGIPRQSEARFYIQLVQNDFEKLEKLKILLNQLGIHTGEIHNPSVKIDPDYFRMFVVRDSQKKFLQEIGTWHPRKIKVLQQRVKI